MINRKMYWKYILVFVLAIGMVGCNNDDDVDDVIPERPTGSIMAADQEVTQNTIIVENVTVGQDSWLVAVNSEDEDSDNFITEPVFIEDGTETDVELTINENADLERDEDGDEISLQLYSDEGTLGQWDNDDQIITDGAGLSVTETIIIHFEETDTATFADFDTNEDGNLDQDEIRATYQYNFETWDADDDGSLNNDEFNSAIFANTDADDDDFVDEDEWNRGFTGMYGNYVEDDFATYDTDGDGNLDSDEWNEVYVETDFYTTYDADENDLVTEDEFNQGLYSDWDTNDDDMVDENEFNVYRPYTSTW